MSNKTSGGNCNHTGKPFYPNLRAAEKAAGPDEEARPCRYCRGAHLHPAKRRKASHGSQGGKRRGRKR